MRQLKLMSAVLPLLLVVLTGCEREENNGMVEEIIFTNIPSKGIRIDEDYDDFLSVNCYCYVMFLS